MTRDSLIELANARGLTRREFIQQAIVASITVSAAEGMFAAMARPLAHGKVAPNFDLDGLKVMQRWWFE